MAASCNVSSLLSGPGLSRLLANHHSIYLYTYIDGLMYYTVSNLERYITSSFAAHELMNTIYLLQNIFGAVSTLVISKIINIWGRIQGLIIMVIFFIIGASFLFFPPRGESVLTHEQAQ